MAETRRTFTREYKLSAVKLVSEQGRSFSEAARSLGIAAELLRRWKATFEADGAEAFPGHGNLPPAEDELRRLKAEVARLKAERDILKKATALFARESL
jgi:transposase